MPSIKVYPLKFKQGKVLYFTEQEITLLKQYRMLRALYEDTYEQAFKDLIANEKECSKLIQDVESRQSMYAGLSCDK